MGADVLINCKDKNLHEEVMRLTNGNGVPRLVEASGASALVNSSFKMLQKVLTLVCLLSKHVLLIIFQKISGLSGLNRHFSLNYL